LPLAARWEELGNQSLQSLYSIFHRRPAIHMPFSQCPIFPSPSSHYNHCDHGAIPPDGSPVKWTFGRFADITSLSHHDRTTGWSYLEWKNRQIRFGRLMHGGESTSPLLEHVLDSSFHERDLGVHNAHRQVVQSRHYHLDAQLRDRPGTLCEAPR
jgi:hypothetical protein